MLNISQLSVSYSNRRVLHDVSLIVESGEVAALIGPNGAGKSTLIRAVSGFIPSSGVIRLDGHTLDQLTSTERARRIAVVPQTVSLPPAFTVWETILFGRTPYLNFLGQLSERDESIARRALERVDALDLIDRRVGELSGGEQQRILLARALAQSTPILLLDEPITHLDLHYQISLLDLVRKLAHEDHLAVLIALHDLNLAARYADKVILLVKGEIKAAGSAREVLRADLISEAYGWRVRVMDHPFLDAPLVLPEK
jgi:iron complex transport system ATP-binding protein